MTNSFLAATEQSGALDQLCQRLDACLQEIEASTRIEPETRAYLLNQGTIYAAFLSDVAGRRITVEEGHAEGMIEAIEVFCDLITNDLKAAA